MMVKVGVYCPRGGGHWACYDQADASACGTKGPDVFIDVAREDYHMYPEWLQRTIDYEKKSSGGVQKLDVTLPALSEDYTLSEIGMKIHNPDMPLSRFSEICYTLGRFHEAVRFAIGDAIIQGEALYGEEAFQAIEEMNLSEDARQEYVRVAQRVPTSRRRKGLSWSHHRAVAALEPAAQKEMLKRAVDEGLSHHALRDELRNGAEPQAATTCRCCGRRL